MAGLQIRISVVNGRKGMTYKSLMRQILVAYVMCTHFDMIW